MDIPPQDDMQWPGTEGFTGFPKHLPEDVVEYCIYIIDATLSDVHTRERLQKFQRALISLEKKFLKEYIWQRDSIQLQLLRENNHWFLKGTTNYGDSIADEWLIVYFLRELSKEFMDAWIKIYDSDGEFLLIEAANSLPKWVDPEIMDNRVWINRGELRLIPLFSPQSPVSLKLDEALDIILKSPLKAEKLPKVEEDAFKRLAEYPKAIGENQHHVILPLPRKIAWLLHTKSAYIAPAVEAFYLRDPISLRLLQPAKTHIPLSLAPDDFVEVSVRFTRVLYAQLRAQDWSPPSSSPYSAALESLATRLLTQLPENASIQDREKAKEKAGISAKLSAGFEMLLRHSIYADKPSVREIALLLEDLENGDEALPSDAEISYWEKREDGEGWLDIDWADFERELAGKGAGVGSTTSETGENKEGMDGRSDTAAQENLRKMVERFTAFMADEDAGLEGAKGLGMEDLDVGDGWDDPMSEDEDSDDEPTSQAQDIKTSKISNSAASESKLASNGGKGKAKVTFADLPPPSNQQSTSAANNTDKENGVEADSDDEAADAEYAEYERNFNAYMSLSSAEKSLLLDDARALALAADAEKEEDEEIQKLSAAMEKELWGHGALNLNPEDTERRGRKLLAGEKDMVGKGKGKGKAKMEEIKEAAEKFGKAKGKRKAKASSARDVWASLYSDEDVEEIPRKPSSSQNSSTETNPADVDEAAARAWADTSDDEIDIDMDKQTYNGELDSDDDDNSYLDADYNLADNMLRSFKGQVGMPGPAGNLMRMMGVQFPPDLEEDEEHAGGDARDGEKRDERRGYARALEEAVRKSANAEAADSGDGER